MKKLKLNSALNHECDHYLPYKVSVEKVVSLYGKSFEKLKNNPSVTNPYIAENHDVMWISGIVRRTDTSGKQIDRDGFMIHIFDSSYEHIMIDMFTFAAGKELRRLADEYRRYAE